MAEVMKFDDFKEEGTENAVKVCVLKMDLGGINTVLNNRFLDQ